MRRFPSGTVDQYIYFVAVDSTDLKTRETGLTTFTVYRARNGAAAAAYTTPTVAEVSSANMPGVYSLLLDEDMTIASGNKSEEVVLHITQASMAPVTLVYELYRPDVTEGETLTVASGIGQASVQSIVANAITATSIATDAITAGKIATDAIGASELAADAATEIGTAVWAAATRTLTANTNLNDLSAAGVRAALGMASANLDTQIGTLATGTDLATVAGYIDTEVAAIKAVTDALPDAGALTSLATAASIAALNDLSAADIADAVWDELLAGHAISGSTGEQLTAAGAAGDPWATALPGAYGAGTAGKLVGDNINAPIGTVDSVVDAIKAVTDLLPDAGALSSLSTASALATVDGAVTAIKAKTDSLAFTVGGQVDANIQYVNDVQVNGTGASGDEWGPV